MDSELVAMEQRLNARFDKVDQRFDGVDGKLDQLDRTMHVLHEDAMTQFKFSLEAVQGTQESLSRQLDERADSIESTMDVIALAVKANRAERA